MSTADELLKANESYAASFNNGHLGAPPARRVAIVTCMDARLLPDRFLGLEEGDAHVIRNAGGRTSEALRSLVISQQLLGTNEVVVIHHTGCGMLSFTNDDLHAKVRDELGTDSSDVDWLPFSDLEQSVRDDVQLLRESPLIGDDVTVRGFVYEVETGKLREIE